jgi:protein gp37
MHNCEYCYARNIARRFSGRGETRCDDNACFILNERKATPYPYGFRPTFHTYRLKDYENKKGRSIFVCSMADLFGQWVPDEWIEKVFAECEKSPQHTYLFLTKNPYRYNQLKRRDKLPCRDNMWYGATATTKEQLAIATNRDQYVYPAGAFALLGPEYKTFLSVEPLLENVADDEWEFGHSIKYCDWVIIGAETGNRKGKVKPEKAWIDDIAMICKKHSIPVFMKESIRPITNNLIQEFPEEVSHE